MLPNWIIIGAPKSATSTLFRWLVDHPEVAGPPEKETYYFVDPGTHMFRPDRNFRDNGLAGYEALFRSCDPSAKAVIEATPGYLYSETALRQLPKLPSRPKFIVVLREPVAQLRSLFCYFQQNWNWIPRSMTFRDFIAAAENGSSDFAGNELARNALSNAWYPDHLRRWRDAVGGDRLLVLLFEELVSDSRATVRQVAGDLGIDPGFYDQYAFPRENSTYVARNGALQDFNIWLRSRLPQGAIYNAVRNVYRAINTQPPTPQSRDLELERSLAERFAPMVMELEREFDLDLSAWKRSAEATSHSPAALSTDEPRIDRPQQLVAQSART